MGTGCWWRITSEDQIVGYDVVLTIPVFNLLDDGLELMIIVLGFNNVLMGNVQGEVKWQIVNNRIFGRI